MIKTLSVLKLSRGLSKLNYKAFSMDIGGMRAEYKRGDEAFTEKDLVSKEPFGQFKHWFEEVRTIPQIKEPNAMCLATCSKDGIPSARYVLLKGYGSDGFKFFTNRGSRKGSDLTSNPRAALVFYWECLNRQIRVEGTVEPLPEQDAVNYFQSRPKESQLGAAISNQSRPIKSRDVMVASKEELRKTYSESSVPMPKEWGGYIVRPHSIEFWQGQSDRVHDRIQFRRPNDGEKPDNVILHQGTDGWVYERLQP